MKNLLNTKLKMTIALVLLFTLLFGLLKPLININNSNYFFGIFEKNPKEYVAKGLLKQQIRLDLKDSENGMLFKPFDDSIVNLKSDFNPTDPIYTESEFNERFWFDNQTMTKVIDKMKFVSCEKREVNGDIGYECQFILDDLTDTGLYEEMVNGKSYNYKLIFIIKNDKYQVFDFKRTM